MFIYFLSLKLSKFDTDMIFQVFHSGIPVTLVPLDATNTIPINKKFFETFEKNKNTYEAQYCFRSLKMARDTWFDDQFYTVQFLNSASCYVLVDCTDYLSAKLHAFIKLNEFNMIFF